MNRKGNRHPPKVLQIKNYLNKLSASRMVSEAIRNGGKVQLNMDVITKHPDYPKKLPSYRKFCEENAGKSFMAEYESGYRNFVHFVEDSTDPRWLFAVGDLKKAEEEAPH